MTAFLSWTDLWNLFLGLVYRAEPKERVNEGADLLVEYFHCASNGKPIFLVVSFIRRPRNFKHVEFKWKANMTKNTIFFAPIEGVRGRRSDCSYYAGAFLFFILLPHYTKSSFIQSFLLNSMKSSNLRLLSQKILRASFSTS